MIKNMITKEYVKELLERYFDAETSLVEEALIMEYFNEYEVDPEFESYAILFRVFSDEKSSYLREARRTVPAMSIGAGRGNADAGRRIGLHKIYYAISAAGVAALLLGLFLIGSKESDSPVLIINGKKIDNTELAIAKAGESFEYINLMLEKVHNSRGHLEQVGKVVDLMTSLGELSSTLSQNEDETHKEN